MPANLAKPKAVHAFPSTLLALLAVLVLIAITTAQSADPARPIPDGFDREASLNAVFAEMGKASNETQGNVASEKMWAVFMLTPDATSAAIMNRGLRARERFDLEVAFGFFSQVIQSQPNYAEAWNQRAYIHFVRKRYDEALADCTKTLELEPRHVGCMAGIARIHLIRKDYARADTFIRRAIALHPWIADRVMLKEIPLERL
ncbi:tetratricopeptide repeat protein [Pseudahrensia aquimaris]|uniref:Tetratricopeptide repeat protein n=1 Tax=Pseudahrensia aquimaris TaxID=744461 RepID=A0ABW3FDY7_9HYPH